MANLCLNSVVLIGSPDRLRGFMETVDKVASCHEYVTPEAIQKEIGFCLKGWGRSCDCAMGNSDDFDVSKIEKGILRFECTTAWDSISSYWDALTEALGLDGWATMSDADGEYWVANDPYGVWFPSNYLFDSGGEGEIAEAGLEYEFYNTKEEVVSALNNALGLEMSFDDWVEYLEEECEGESGAIKIINRCGEQVLPFTGFEEKEDKEI